MTIANLLLAELEQEAQTTRRVLEPLAAELGAAVGHDDAVSKVSVVGAGMRTRTGVAEKMFAALAAEQINLRMITPLLVSPPPKVAIGWFSIEFCPAARPARSAATEALFAWLIAPEEMS